MRTHTGLAAFGLLFVSTLWAQGPSQPETDAQVDRLLSQAKSQASMLKSDVATLDFFIVSESGFETNASLLDLYLERASALRGLAAQLNKESEGASRWRQFSAAQVAPLMQQFASATEDTVKACRSNFVSAPEFRAYLKARSDLADELYRLISAWIDYGKTREELTGMRVSGRKEDTK